MVINFYYLILLKPYKLSANQVKKFNYKLLRDRFYLKNKFNKRSYSTLPHMTDLKKKFFQIILTQIELQDSPMQNLVFMFQYILTLRLN